MLLRSLRVERLNNTSRLGGSLALPSRALPNQGFSNRRPKLPNSHEFIPPLK